VVEEPMEIRLLFGVPEKRMVRSLSVTMRTPGEDEELAAGFLFTEGILSSPDQIEAIEARGVDASGQPTGNTIRVALRPEVEVDFAKLQRHFYTSSSCGVCGKASLEMLELRVTTSSGDLAYGTGILHLTGLRTDGKRTDLRMRMTSVLQRIKGKWLIVHEHISVPVNTETGQAFLTAGAPGRK